MASNDVTARILRACMVEIGRHGLDGVSMRSLAEASGVSRPTVYARFSNKQALFKAVVEHAFSTALQDVGAQVDAGGPLEEVLARALLSYFGSLYEQVLALEKADEFIKAQLEHAPQVVELAQAELHKHLHRALAGVEPPAGVSRAQLVELLAFAPRGFKQPGITLQQYRRRLRALARTVAHSTSPSAL